MSSFTQNTSNGVFVAEVSNEADLNTAIDEYDQTAATGSQYEIDIVSPPGEPTANGFVVDSTGIDTIAPTNAATLTINSGRGSDNPADINGADQFSGFVVAAGTVNLENLVFVDMVANNGAGAVAAEGGSVTLQNVQFTGNTGTTAPNGEGFGGDIVVLPQNGASLDIEGSSNFAPGSTNPNAQGFGSGIFISGGGPGDPPGPGSITIGANDTNNTAVVVQSVIADGTGAGLVDENGNGVGVGQVVIGDGSTPAFVILDPQVVVPSTIDDQGNITGDLVNQTNNLYTGGTLIQSGTLVLGMDGSAGTGAISFGSTAGGDGVVQTLVTDADPTPSVVTPFVDDGEDFALALGDTPALNLQNTLTNFGQGDALIIESLPFLAGSTATLDPTTGILAVTNGVATEDFAMSAPAGTSFVVSDVAFTDSSGVEQDVAEVQLAPPPVVVVAPGGTPTPPATTTSPPANNPTAVTTTPIISPSTNNSIAPTLTFNPNVSVFENEITYSGTTTPGATVALTADTGLTDQFSLGSVVADANGDWSLTSDKLTRGLNDFVTGTATLGGLSTTVESGVDVTAGLGPKRMGFTTIQDNYDPAGDFLGSTFIKGGGGVFAKDHHTILNDGGERYTYTGGSLLKDMQVTSFSASYIDDGNLTGSILHNDDGTTYIENDAKYQFVNSHHDDTIQEDGSHSHFIFHDGAGHETISGFKLGSDTISLPSDASILGGVIQVYDASAHQFDTTVHLGHDLSITFDNLKKDQLIAHASDLTFHG